MGFKPTPEQDVIRDAAATGIRMKIKAGAGTGKTSTLKLISDAMPNKNVLFVAYNRAIKDDAAKKFPRNVECMTSHGLAYRATNAGQQRARLNAPRQTSRDVARILGIREPIWVKKELAPLAPQQTARIVMETVTRFCYSADDQINKWNVPRQPGLEDKADHEELAKAIVPLAQRAWADIKDDRGLLRWSHDYYLKMWALSGQKLHYDAILLDEAQDSNKCVSEAIMKQKSQVILVGDGAQAIYSWRGADDAMRQFDGQEFLLSKSFRFGQGVANEANKWLATMPGETLRITGFEQLNSVVTGLGITEADAVICRTNAGTIRKAIEAFDAGLRPALVGGAKSIENLALAAIDLKNGRPTSHPELYLFPTWQMVQDYVEHDHGGSDLAAFVKLVDSIGAEAILDVCQRLGDERYAKLKIMTGHKAKGLEFPNVLISDDFREPSGNDKDTEPKLILEESRLAYVSVTRAQSKIDPGSLNYINKFGADGRIKPEFRNMTRSERESVVINSYTAVYPGLEDYEMVGETFGDRVRALRDEDAAAVESAESGRFDGYPAEIVANLTPTGLAMGQVDGAVLQGIVDDAGPKRAATVPLRPKSTCACDPAAAKRTADLIGQPCGPDVPRCFRCGGGQEVVAID